MTLTLSSPRKRFLVLGPMSSTKTDAEELPLSQHIPNIADAVRQVIGEIGEMERWEAVVPPTGAGSTTPRVFRDIFHCDAAIADISTGSPNVVYELALLHSVGVPTILIARADTDIFYLKDQNRVNVADFDVATIHDALIRTSENIRDARNGHVGKIILSPRRSDRTNPITDHFKGVHLVNVASATGLATGQWFNFLSYILDRRGIFSSREHRNLKGIVLIRPDRIDEARLAQRAIEDAFEEPKRGPDGEIKLGLDGKPVMWIPEIVRQEPAHMRSKIFVKHVGDWLIDYPTPILSLKVSKQYEEILNFVRDQPQTDGIVSPDDLAIAPFEASLIDVYFETLSNLAHTPGGHYDWHWVKIMRLDEAIKFLRKQRGEDKPSE